MVFKINNTGLTSSSVMSFKDYYIKSINLKNINFSDDWGWFIDIESNYPDTNKLFSKYRKETQNIINIPQTINELPSIRSLKSMRNLYDDLIILKIDEDLVKYNKYKRINYIIHSVCILGIIGVCYIFKIL